MGTGPSFVPSRLSFDSELWFDNHWVSTRAAVVETTTQFDRGEINQVVSNLRNAPVSKRTTSFITLRTKETTRRENKPGANKRIPSDHRGGIDGTVSGAKDFQRLQPQAVVWQSKTLIGKTGLDGRRS